MREPNSFAGEFVQVRRAHSRMSEATQVAIAQVIAQENDDVGLLRLGGLRGKNSAQSHSERREDLEYGFHRYSVEPVEAYAQPARGSILMESWPPLYSRPFMER